VLSLVECPTSSPPGSTSFGGVCHTSGYTTFSVSGTSSVCCPNGWATTPLNTELFCFTDATTGVEKRQASTETAAAGPGVNTIVEIQGVVFTTAGAVTHDVTSGGEGSSTSSGGGSAVTGTSTTSGGGSATTRSGTGAAAIASPSKSAGVKMDVGMGWGIAAQMGAVVYSYSIGVGFDIRVRGCM
jgi:hypothetical protein